MHPHGEGKQKSQVHIPWLADPRWDACPRVLVGIDDTDNLDSRGTGFRARHLALQLQQAGLARLHSVTRHQLFVSPEIPYTSHNSAACLALDCDPDDIAALQAFCADYLARESAEGSDAGLCVAPLTAVGPEISGWGRRAKIEVLQIPDSHALAAGAGLFLVGLTGTRQGVIGALAAVGLHRTRDDGRFLWMRGVRDLQAGTYLLSELRARTGIERFETLAGAEVVDDHAEVSMTDWARPVFRRGAAVLLLEADEHAQPPARSCRHWRVAARDVIKRF